MKALAPQITHRRVNLALNLILICLALYIVFAPLLANAGLWLRRALPSKPPLVAAAARDDNPKSDPIPDENMLVIPALEMQQAIYDGRSAATLSKGIWRRPNTSNPSQGKNTVLVGHRFTYSDPAVFYHLDKIRVGDKIVVYWERIKYTYEVSRTFVVPATAVEIEAPSEEPLLTLYTCTPIWTAKDRLVVQAKLKEQP